MAIQTTETFGTPPEQAFSRLTQYLGWTKGSDYPATRGLPSETCENPYAILENPGNHFFNDGYLVLSDPKLADRLTAEQINALMQACDVFRRIPSA